MRSIAVAASLAAVARGDGEKYLVPLLTYGPNNQFDGLLEATALAEVTGRTLLLPSHFSRWYRDDSSADMVPFEAVFDRAPLLASGRAAIVDAATRELWERKRPWSVLASPLPQDRLARALAQLGLDGKPGKKSVVKAHSRADDVRRQFEGSGLRDATFVCVAPLFVIDGERQLLLRAAALRVRSDRVRRYADRARRALFGDAEVGTIAMQVAIKRRRGRLRAAPGGPRAFSLVFMRLRSDPSRRCAASRRSWAARPARATSSARRPAAP